MINTKPVAVVIGATSKWQSDGRNTRLAHGRDVDDAELPVTARWGVGGAIAQKFAREGFHVVLTTRTAKNAAALDGAIREQGGACSIVELDLASADSIAGAFARVRESVGDPQVVVLNAGYLEGRDLPPEQELLEHIPLEMFETAQNIASRGPFLVAKAVMPAMRERGWGRVVAITSVAVRQPIPNLILSNTARAGVTGFLKTLALEVAADGVTVNSVQPGTHATDRLVGLGADPDELAAGVAAGTIGDPDDFGAVCAFLCSTHARFVTGVALPVDGGAYRGLQ